MPNEWISIKERKRRPPKFEDVLVYVKRTSDGQPVDGWIEIASRRTDGLWITGGGMVEDKSRVDFRKVTHWQPLPTPPAPEGEK
jgi:hypothetical protein